VQGCGRRLGAHLDLARAVAGLCGPLEFLLLKAVRGCEEEIKTAVKLAAEASVNAKATRVQPPSEASVEQIGMTGSDNNNGSLFSQLQAALELGLRAEDTERRAAGSGSGGGSGAATASTNHRALCFARGTSVDGALAGSLRAQGLCGGSSSSSSKGLGAGNSSSGGHGSRAGMGTSRSKGKGMFSSKPQEKSVALAAADAVACALMRRAQYEEIVMLSRGHTVSGSGVNGSGMGSWLSRAGDSEGLASGQGQESKVKGSFESSPSVSSSSSALAGPASGPGTSQSENGREASSSGIQESKQPVPATSSSSSFAGGEVSGLSQPQSRSQFRG